MQKRQLKSNRAKTPFVKFKAGDVFTGRFIGIRDTQIGKAYSFSVIDGTADFGTNNDQKVFEPKSVVEGEEVTVFGCVQLDDVLSGASEGEKIEITFNGKKKNAKTGREYKDYSVFVIE